MGKIKAVGGFTVGYAPDSIPTATPTNCGVWNATTNYKRDVFIAPYVKHEGAYYLRISDGNCIGINPKTDVASQSQYWQHNEIIDLFCARKIQADEIDVENLTAARVSTKKSGPRVEIVGSVIRVFGQIAKNIEFGVNTSGMAVLCYYNDQGRLLYNLGPNGIDWGSIVPESWSSLGLVRIGSYTGTTPRWADVSSVLNANNLPTVTYYKYSAGNNPEVGADKKEKEKYLFTAQNYNGAKIPDGWYTQPGTNDLYPSDNTGMFVTPIEGAIYLNDAGGLRDRPPMFMRTIMLYIGGIYTDTKEVLWNA